MGKHLKFSYETAQIDCGEMRHAQTVMKELGITYQMSTPQSMSDSFWFWNCENIPEKLPKYLNYLNIEDPMEWVGWGISEEDAIRIKNCK